MSGRPPITLNLWVHAYSISYLDSRGGDPQPTAASRLNSTAHGRRAPLAAADVERRRWEALDEAAKLIGSNVAAIQADASRLEDLDRVADAVRRAKGKVDVVVVG